MIHELKTWPEYFQAVFEGRKTFELRKNDRNYREGDILFLREWDPEVQDYTGRELSRTAGYILEGGKFGVESGVVVIALICERSSANVQVLRKP